MLHLLLKVLAERLVVDQAACSRRFSREKDRRRNGVKGPGNGCKK